MPTFSFLPNGPRVGVGALLLGLALLVAVGAWSAAPRPATATTAPTADAAEAAAIQAQIQAALDDPNLPSAFWGIYVQNLRTGQVVYQQNADRNFLPASNQKLFTTAAALVELGPNYRYQTALYFDGQTVGSNTLRGDLVLRGSGDPTFGSARTDNDPLATWAQRLAALGVRRIEGRVIGDGRAFERNPYAEGWDLGHITSETYAPPTSGLSYRDNLVTIRVEGTRAGAAARVTAAPASLIRFENNVVTRGRGGYGPFSADRILGSNTFVLNGSVSDRYRGETRLPIEQPVLWTVHHFAQRLSEQGIEVAAELVDARTLDAPPRYDGLEPLLIHRSPPMHELVREINVRSNNLYAEHVFRTLGDGTSAGGTRRILALLNRAGIPTQGLSIRDGSGLSRKDLITPQSLGRLLAYMHTHPQGTLYKNSLAQGGQARSTLRYRLAEVPVQAKTGSLEYVRALSGYVQTPGGAPLAFVLIANNYTVRAGQIASAQDRIVRTLATGGAL